MVKNLDFLLSQPHKMTRAQHPIKTTPSPDKSTPLNKKVEVPLPDTRKHYEQKTQRFPLPRMARG